MSNEQTVKLEEQKRVDVIVSEIKEKLTNLTEHKEKVSSDALEIRKTFWNDVTINFDEADDIAETYSSIKQQAQLLSERDRSQGQLNKQIQTLSRLKNSPYFGRVDFKEEGEKQAESIYLGITSFMDKDDENFLIYDWRAPISSIYYDFAPGPANYHTPEGTIEGNMELKRQFIIKNSKIEGMFDTGVTIGDQLLQEVLGNNASTQMKSIVATIQREQNQIIRNEKSKVLMVQGVAGSGKTSAALQRVAYLLYRYRGIITSQNIMLFSPNPLFNSYISTVLPELGEENMQQTTFFEYLGSRIEKRMNLEDSFTQLEDVLNSEGNNQHDIRLMNIQLKSSLLFKEMIENYVKSLDIKGMEFTDIILKGTVLVSKEQLKEKFYTYDQSYSIPNRVELLQEWLLKELRKLKKLEKKKDWVREEIQFLDKEDFLDAYKELQRKKEFNQESFDDFEREEKILAEVLVSRYFKPLIRKVKKMRFINFKKIYSQLFVGEQDIQKWNDIREYTLSRLNEDHLNYEDATPYVYLKDLIEGRKMNLSIRHVFIDEAQDYSPFQFAYIKQLFPQSKMTLLGDINQGIYTHSTYQKSMLQDTDFTEEDQETIILTRSYRSTRPIVEFTKTLLHDGSLIEAFNRDGNKPTFTQVEKKEQLQESVLEKVKDMQSKGHKTIAVICKSATESAEAFAYLNQHLDVHLMEKGTITFESGIVVIPAYLAKGIEFDAVIIYDASNHVYGRESERRLFYTACTRAMHELHLFSMGEKSFLLKNSGEYLYSL
ncbi:RNA polymerase recycling motor HelD [Bacillus sp. 31A1R]|uniref:RNA polymerase recycling motor HelD n=1 Tax=Robertmurraya mangrovi TaxID=3098077 RepID=A0ABU5J066_9BACI|nr:RNA polymerase recycling motor HelD [Bacillus sp. 31A1R]MDZ5472804.1 RNA polymerase recycling motor HelD [Bacillus sp. 31A1R]